MFDRYDNITLWAKQSPSGILSSTSAVSGVNSVYSATNLGNSTLALHYCFHFENAQKKFVTSTSLWFLFFCTEYSVYLNYCQGITLKAFCPARGSNASVLFKAAHYISAVSLITVARTTEEQHTPCLLRCHEQLDSTVLFCSVTDCTTN